MTLTRSGTPLYLQLSELLEKQIDAGEFPPESKLPGDAALSEKYGVSLITARAAMRVLIDKQRIARFPGRGTFVRSPERIREWGLGSIPDLVLTGLKSKLIILDRGLRVCPKWVYTKFSLPPNTKLYAFRTARESQGELFTITDIYHPPHIGKLIKDADFDDIASENKLMITVVQEKTGIQARDINQTITAEMADSKTAKELGIRPGEPLLVFDRDYYAKDGQPIQTGRSKYRVDHYRYQINVSRFHRSVPESDSQSQDEPGPVARLQVEAD
jgi:GntR family transcriptional regulator